MSEKILKNWNAAKVIFSQREQIKIIVLIDNDVAAPGHQLSEGHEFNLLRPEQNGWHFAFNIAKCIFLTKIIVILSKF